MFEKITQLAEAAATRVSLSRRGFLGRLGQGALAVGALLAGSAAPARGGQTGVVCCKYACSNFPYKGGKSFSVSCQAAGTTCSPFSGFCELQQQSTASDCTQCK